MMEHHCISKVVNQSSKYLKSSCGSKKAGPIKSLKTTCGSKAPAKAPVDLKKQAKTLSSKEMDNQKHIEKDVSNFEKRFEVYDAAGRCLT